MIDYPFVDHYDWKGCLLDDPDDDMPTLRRHCIKCGAFLQRKPEEITRMVPTDWDYTYEQGEISGIVIHREEQEVDAIWTCKKCNHEHDSEEMYI